jgi:hypothetical protein
MGIICPHFGMVDKAVKMSTKTVEKNDNSKNQHV